MPKSSRAWRCAATTLWCRPASRWRAQPQTDRTISIPGPLTGKSGFLSSFLAVRYTRRRLAQSPHAKEINDVAFLAQRQKTSHDKLVRRERLFAQFRPAQMQRLRGTIEYAKRHSFHIRSSTLRNDFAVGASEPEPALFRRRDERCVSASDDGAAAVERAQRVSHLLQRRQAPCDRARADHELFRRCPPREGRLRHQSSVDQQSGHGRRTLPEGEDHLLRAFRSVDPRQHRTSARPEPARTVAALQLR